MDTSPAVRANHILCWLPAPHMSCILATVPNHNLQISPHNARLPPPQPQSCSRWQLSTHIPIFSEWVRLYCAHWWETNEPARNVRQAEVGLEAATLAAFLSAHMLRTPKGIPEIRGNSCEIFRPLLGFAGLNHHRQVKCYGYGWKDYQLRRNTIWQGTVIDSWHCATYQREVENWDEWNDDSWGGSRS